MKRLAAALGMFLAGAGLSLAGLSVAQTPDPALSEGLARLEEGRTTLEEKALTIARSYFEQLTRKDPPNAVYFYELARVDGYRVDAYANRKDKKNAEGAMGQALAEVQHAISLNEKLAEAHSLLADLYGRKIGLGGFMLGPRLGPKIDPENKKALALAPDNPRVLASYGRECLHAPKMFGGDVDKAIESFRKSTELDPKSDETFVWLALAYRKKGDAPSADKALQEALRLNPRSVFAENVQAQK
jgi:tetratricopeptide (TPR) repeat protein